MTFKVFSGFLQGITPHLVEVESSVSQGLRSFSIVGLGDKAIEEARERVSSALKHAGLRSPRSQNEKVLINLAPASLKKQGAVFDLAIAISYLGASKQILFNPQKKLFLGELSLEGQIKPINGVLSFCLLAQKKGLREIFVPKKNALEASLANLVAKNESEKLQIYAVESLEKLISFLQNQILIQPVNLNWFEEVVSSGDFDIQFNWIKGQHLAKRALEIAAAGGHNILFEGPPGAGKTLLAKSIVSILPPLDTEEMIEVTQIYSAAGFLPEGGLVTQRPFRHPHHSSSEAALIGGGNPPRPGEITLAHRGVLFLDEFPEFHRDVLESLRGPLEDGRVTITRTAYRAEFPSKFILIAAANPCPCGYYGHPEKVCTCTASQINAYRRKLSGPLIDRVDLFCYVPSLKYNDLVAPETNQEQMTKIKENIKTARAIQKERLKKEGLFTNSEMNLSQIKKFCVIPPQAQKVLKSAVDSFRLSARGYFRVLKIARTIADLQQKDAISSDDIMEALNFKQLFTQEEV